MITDWNPMLWPTSWKDPSALDLLQGTVINHILLEKGAEPSPIAKQAIRKGFAVSMAGSSIPNVTVVDGEWPGVKLTESGTVDRAEAGPTGVPWVDSNGWKIRLMQALHQRTDVWVSAAPQKPRFSDSHYQIGIADAAAHGGRWIVSLDPQLAADLLDRKPEALQRWRKIADAVGYFSARKEWTGFRPAAIIGILSDFTGKNEFMNQELLNLIARTNQQYRVLLKTAIGESDLQGLKAVLYADEDAPDAALRARVLAFVQEGGVLITGPKWGPVMGSASDGGDYPRYELRTYGKGRLAIARPDFEDPYLAANDSAILISHRHELVRFWNGGAVGSFLTVDPAGGRALLQLLFYAATSGRNYPAVRVVGTYRKAMLHTLDSVTAMPLEVERQKEAIELHLPPVSGYAAVVLEA